MDRNFNLCNEPALWGGIECTINRVGDEFMDQLALTGHYDRGEDIREFAGLGIVKMRYPVLWEHHAPVRHRPIDWTATAGKLDELRQYGIDPVAGLVHHGSGPSYTHLLDPDFGARLSEYAFEVSNRFPFISDYTPVNEPLTTARFSGLYGLWYPQHRDDRSFAQMLLNQLKGIVLSMQAIRTVNPDAQLIQTEDLGKTHSTPGLAYQAEFENHRRWLSYDILCGRFQPGHPLWYWFVGSLGIPENELRFFSDNPCPPDVLGLNYYVTSERWLDEDLILYPESTHGGNQFGRYADTEVVRARPEARLGIQRLGTEVWERYRIPLALTEVHLHCTREEQMRWWAEIRQSAVMLCRKGIPVLGVTAWSLLGAFDWDSLLTQAAGHYEPGVFVTEGSTIRPTALATLISGNNDPALLDHPLLQTKGWWHGAQKADESVTGPYLMIKGNGGPVGHALEKACRIRGIRFFHCQQKPVGPEEIFAGDHEAECWAELYYSGEESLEFYSEHMQLSADRKAPVDPLVNQVLDLVIDATVRGRETDAGTGTYYTDRMAECPQNAA